MGIGELAPLVCIVVLWSLQLSATLPVCCNLSEANSHHNEFRGSATQSSVLFLQYLHGMMTYAANLEGRPLWQRLAATAVQ